MTTGKDLYLGLDVGSISVKGVVCSAAGEILDHRYVRHNGLPYQSAFQLLRALFARHAPERFRAVGATGTGGEQLAELLRCRFVNEFVAQTRAVIARTPHVRTVIEMGGQDSKLLLLEEDDRTGRPVLRDFSMNALCAAGTGSFLDQQASRLGIAIEEEFGRLALECKHPPHMAGRCSVFAKSDMIHLQQTAAPVQDIVAGLCFALARNFRSTIGQGKSFRPPVSFQGGVASNAGMRRAFEEVLDLKPGQLIVDPYHRVMGALGVAHVLMDENAEMAPCDLDALEIHTHSKAPEAAGLEPLAGALTDGGRQEAPDRIQHSALSTQDSALSSVRPAGEKLDVFLGIDVGSVSTNVVLMDREGRLVTKRYLSTAGRPIEAVRRGIEDICREVGESVVVRGCGTTGSGRYLIGDLVGADVIRNEITAQATAAIAIDPTVDTIFEIGGQDSKYISIHAGAVCDFEMNKACAAGTGSFLEEQAERLGMRIEVEFADRALAARCPVALGDRCTVFMESDLLHHQQAGAGKEDLVAGLAYSIVHNYLNRVVGDRRVGRRVFFQGGTAFNRAVVAAFNRVLGRPVVVPPHHEVTGAIGVALLARDQTKGESKFKGFDWSNRNYQIETFLCNKCANSCEIRRVQVENDRPLFYGSRCERFEVDRGKRNDRLPDLFAERAAALRACLNADDFPPATRGRVGIPMTLLFQEFLPLWATFFRALGFEVVLSGDTTKAVIHEGIERVVAETCYPIKVAHGHVAALVAGDVDFIFLPSVINAATPEYGPRDRWSFNCPLVQTIPYMVRGAGVVDPGSRRLFSPALYMQSGPREICKALARHRLVLRSTRREISRALERGYEAQERFRRWLVERGRQALDGLAADDKALVIVGRPYNAFDSGLNLDIPKKLRNLNVLAIPMDMLPLDETPLPSGWHSMYWRYGQRIIKAAEIIRRDPRLFAVYITNFSCGPDSFLLSFFDHQAGDKPHLQIEIDEHSADAGVVTRCEAYLDTLANCETSRAASDQSPLFGLHLRRYTDHRKIYIPNMSNHVCALEAAMRSLGIDAHVMPESDNESVLLGRQYTSGKECYPALLTVGDMVRQVRRSDFDPARSAFIMAATDGPCRFGQYRHLQRLVLDGLGLCSVPLYIVDQDETFTEDLRLVGGEEFERRAWTGICAVDALERLLLSTRPYEVHRGETDQWFDRSLRAVRDAIAEKRSVNGVLREARRQHEQIETRGRGSRPLIALVGEIYVRANRFANDYVIERIERLGGEVAIPTMGEWLNYSHFTRSRRKWWHRDLGALIGNTLRGFVQSGIERRVYGRLGVTPEPPVQNLLRYAQPYLDSSYEGESILTLGKSVELVREHGAAGIINAMPFTCMPGTIVSALVRQLRNDCQGIPVLTMIFTGQQNLTNRIRLEAFMHQARCFHESKR
jgi:predicted CoA-substrate-specific enzyme activase